MVWLVEEAGAATGAREVRACGRALGADLRGALLDEERLGAYAPGVYAEALSALIAAERGDEAAVRTLVLLPHTYRVAEFAPLLAMRLGAAYVPSICGAEPGGDDGGPLFRRSIMQARLQAEVRPRARTVVVTVQSGAFGNGEPAAPRRIVEVGLPADIERRREREVLGREAAGAGAWIWRAPNGS